MSSFLFDLRHALRALRKRPGFTAIVVVTMAVGIGSNVGIFAYLSYFLWPPFEAPERDRVAWVYTHREDDPTGALSYPDWLDLRRDTDVFSQLAGYRLYGRSIRTKTRTLFAWGHAVSGDYFSLFGTVPHLGRLIGPEDDREDAPGVLVLNHLYWKRSFDGDPEVVGEAVYLDGRVPYTVVGVAPPGFQGQGFATDVYVPLANCEPILPPLRDRGDRRLITFGRLKPGLTLAAAQAAVTPFSSALDEAHPEEEARQLTLRPVTESVWDDADPLVNGARMLMAAVSLLLLLAVTNVANLMLARGAERRREMGICSALGAGRRRLTRRLLLEGLLLAGAGGVLGLGLARGIRVVLESYLLKTVPVGMGSWGQASHLVADPGRMTAFTVAVTVAAGLVFGLAPVVQTFRADLVTALKTDAASGAGRPGRRLGGRHLLVVVQVALALVLLLGAGLLVRSLWGARSGSFGFEPRGLTVATVYVPSDSDADGRGLYQDVLDRTRALPGVQDVSLTRILPLAGFSDSLGAVFPGEDETSVHLSLVAPRYFSTLQIPLLAGRDFDERDREESPRVTVANQRAAERFWPGESPVGRFVRLKDGGEDPAGTPYEVVGVVADSTYKRPVDPIEPLFYVTFHQRFNRRLTLLMRSAAPVAGPLHGMLRRHYPELAIIDLVPFQEQLRRAVSDEKMNADLAGGFGALGLFLAALGIFAVMSLTVSGRFKELGIRMALGASGRTVAAQVLGEGSRLFAAGAVVGLGAAFALTRFLKSMLYGVGALDVATFVAVPLLLAAVALAAAWLPARRAGRIEAVVALRQE